MQNHNFPNPAIPAGWVRLIPGDTLRLGDCVYRFAFAQFIPFSLNQIRTADRVLTGEIVIRRKEATP